MRFFRRKVKQGIALGRKIGYPTLNFNVGKFGDHHNVGVYACDILIHGKSYTGALFFGPAISCKSNVLEIHVLGFSGHIYNEFIKFHVGKKLREPKRFKSPDELKKQIGIDLGKVV